VNGTRSGFCQVKGFGVSGDERVVLQLTKLPTSDESTCRFSSSCFLLAVGGGVVLECEEAYGEAEVYE
jgi:hypothetical protein